MCLFTSMSKHVVQYKEAVDSGKITKEKKRGDTPPPGKKKRTKLAQIVTNLKSARARRKWRLKEEGENLFGLGYEMK
jgi:hypothetical protein